MPKRKRQPSQKALMRMWAKQTGNTKGRVAPEKIIRDYVKDLDAAMDQCDLHRGWYLQVGSLGLCPHADPVASVKRLFVDPAHVAVILGNYGRFMAMLLDIRRAKMMGIDVDAILKDGAK